MHMIAKMSCREGRMHARARWSLPALAGLPLLFAVVMGVTPASAHNAGLTLSATTHRHYHNGVFGQAAREFCRRTDNLTPSHKIRTKIVRSTDKWSNTISSRYRKFNHCTARQMTRHVWCTTKRVDGVSTMCITPQPRARGASPCRQPRLDVRGVYHPKTGNLRITCVNEH